MARTQYTEELLLKVKTDKTELEKIQKDFDELKVTELLSPEAKKELEQEFKRNQERLVKLKQIEQEITKVRQLGGKAAEDALEKLEDAYKLLSKEIDKDKAKSAGAKSDVGKVLKDGIKDGLVDAGKKAWKAITDVAKDAFKQAVEMMRDMVRFSDSSRIFSEEAANLKLTYGLEGEEAYALTNALKDVGLGSVEEYLEKGWMLNEKQTKYLQEQITLYKDSFKQDEEIALEFQNFEVEWKQFKKELSIELIHFFMENKETIKSVMKMLMNFMQGVLKFVSWFMDVYSTDDTRTDSQRREATSDILQSYSITNGGNSTRTVSVSNTFNGVQSTDRTELINAGSMTYQQIIEVLK